MRLGVNIDHIATIRELRGVNYPEPVEAALIAESNGADGITVHLRVDRRHIKERDIILLRQVIKTHLNVECSIDEKIQDFINDIKPHWVCLVPERREEITTEGGLNLKGFTKEIEKTVKKLKKNNIKVSLFIEPDIEAVYISKDIGADAIEINTGKYADTLDRRILKKIEESARRGSSLGIEVHAGHGLNLQNVGAIAEIQEIIELSIGHSIVARAVIVGLGNAVREMKEKIEYYRRWKEN